MNIFSITIASSTTKPTDKTIPSNVKTLIVNPLNRERKAPINETGMVRQE